MDREELAGLYRQVRARTQELCAPLAVEDMVVQTMPDASPTKWHLAHSSWFFETFVLKELGAEVSGTRPEHFRLFNSYYNAVGEQHPRAQRGLLSRPTVREILDYRSHVDQAMASLFERASAARFGKLAPIVEIGLNHEEQHQELLLTDVKTVLCGNPLHPAYDAGAPRRAGVETPLEWTSHAGGLVEIGHDGEGFAYDIEAPRHRAWLEPFELASRLVTCGEYLAFMEDGGYERSDPWLSDGWDAVRASRWRAPLYWEKDGAGWMVVTLAGPRELDPTEPVCHVSWFEADAYARWAGARLPREEEWEVVAASAPVHGNLLESRAFHPLASAGSLPGGIPAQLFGDAWEWTSSPYVAYPGYVPYQGALAEYNSKFTCNQFVLRGGSCATPGRHVRATYRNFFPPSARWQFTGIRLAR